MPEQPTVPAAAPATLPGGEDAALAAALNAIYHEGVEDVPRPGAAEPHSPASGRVASPTVPDSSALPVHGGVGFPASSPSGVSIPGSGAASPGIPAGVSSGAAPPAPSRASGATAPPLAQPDSGSAPVVPSAGFAAPAEIETLPGPRSIHRALGSPPAPAVLALDTEQSAPYWMAFKRHAGSIEASAQPFRIFPLDGLLEPTRIVENLPNPPKKPPPEPPANEFFIDKLLAMSGQDIAAAGPKAAAPDPAAAGGAPVAETPNESSIRGGGFYWMPSTSGVKSSGAKPEAAGDPGVPAPFDVESVRKDFPILSQRVNGKPLVWLDNAATTQKPRAVIERIARYYEQENSNVHRAAHELAARATDAYEAAREKVRRFLGAASVDEIVFTRGTTESINLVAKSWGKQNLGEGDEIILTEVEHHSNIVPWQMVARETGAKLRVAPIHDSGELDLGAYERLFNDRTRLVAITHVSNALGTVLPVRELVATAHRRGVIALVDGAQSVPHFPVNMIDIDADFYAISGHKLFGPTGVGVLYGKKQLLESMPPWQGGGNMIERVSFEETSYNPPPSKFEAGTAILAGAVGLGAAIDYLERIGFVNAARYEDELLHYAQGQLAAIPGVIMIGTARHKAGVLSFVTDRVTPSQMGEILNNEGIAVRTGHHCAQPALAHYGLEATIRPSLAFYNTRAEIDLLVRTVDQAIRAAK